MYTVGLLYYEDLSKPIPRDEVKIIVDVIKTEVEGEREEGGLTVHVCRSMNVALKQVLKLLVVIDGKE